MAYKIRGLYFYKANKRINVLKFIQTYKIINKQLNVRGIVFND